MYTYSKSSYIRLRYDRFLKVESGFVRILVFAYLGA